MSQRPWISDVEPLSGSQRDPFFGHLDILHRDVFGTTWLPTPDVRWLGDTQPHVSVGPGELPVQLAGNELPPVVAGTTPEFIQTAEVLTEAVGIPEPLDQIIVWGPAAAPPEAPVYETLIADSPEQYAKLVALYPNNPVQKNYGDDTLDIPVFNPGAGGWSPGVFTPPINPTPEDTSMDLGDIYTTIDGALGGWLPGGAPVGSSIINPPVASAPPPVIVNQPGPVATTPATVPAPASCSPQQMVYKLVNGQWRWVKKPRRRRRRLLTKSDAADLAALKGIVGQGKIMETWIATHVR